MSSIFHTNEQGMACSQCGDFAVSACGGWDSFLCTACGSVGVELPSIQTEWQHFCMDQTMKATDQTEQSTPKGSVSICPTATGASSSSLDSQSEKAKGKERVRSSSGTRSSRILSNHKLSGNSRAIKKTKTAAKKQAEPRAHRLCLGSAMFSGLSAETRVSASAAEPWENRGGAGKSKAAWEPAADASADDWFADGLAPQADLGPPKAGGCADTSMGGSLDHDLCFNAACADPGGAAPTAPALRDTNLEAAGDSSMLAAQESEAWPSAGPVHIDNHHTLPEGGSVVAVKVEEGSYGEKAGCVVPVQASGGLAAPQGNLPPLPARSDMDCELKQRSGLVGPFSINDNAFRRLEAFTELLREAHGEVEVEVSARAENNCVLGFHRLNVRHIAAFNMRIRAMIQADPKGIWRKVNGKGSAELKLPTAPLYEVLRKIGVKPAGARELGGLPGEEDRFWRAQWVYHPANLTAKTVARMNKGHEYSSTTTSTGRKQARRAL